MGVPRREPSRHRLEIVSLPNQDSVLVHGTPGLLCCDDRNRRADYLGAWWKVINSYFAEVDTDRALVPSIRRTGPLRYSGPSQRTKAGTSSVRMTHS